MTTTGTLFGIGVGPGDPELIPLKAIRVLEKMEVVFTASSAKNDYSLAIEIARAYIPENAAIVDLRFPMSKDKSVMEKAWQKNAARIAGVLEAGQSAAFLTVGDPMTYSTYGYVLRHLRVGWPHLPVTTIPGITAYQAAAAATNQALVEGEEALLILSGVNGGERFRALAQKPDNVVFMKAYRNVDGICRALEETDRLDSSVAVANCSREDETIYRDLKTLREQRPNYWTLILSRPKRHVSTEG
jgi:precorrin-2/cobalt-factor-2 C20-methyltransferase